MLPYYFLASLVCDEKSAINCTAVPFVHDESFYSCFFYDFLFFFHFQQFDYDVYGCGSL